MVLMEGVQCSRGMVSKNVSVDGGKEGALWRRGWNLKYSVVSECWFVNYGIKRQQSERTALASPHLVTRSPFYCSYETVMIPMVVKTRTPLANYRLLLRDICMYLCLHLRARPNSSFSMGCDGGLLTIQPVSPVTHCSPSGPTEFITMKCPCRCLCLKRMMISYGSNSHCGCLQLRSGFL